MAGKDEFYVRVIKLIENRQYLSSGIAEHYFYAFPL
jgi:hypothetical protein